MNDIIYFDQIISRLMKKQGLSALIFGATGAIGAVFSIIFRI
jgi:hypothetical protein